MIIYPDIEIQKGRCVSLYRGELGRPHVYETNPVEAAHEFVAKGAKRLHVVDLDAVAGTGDNADIIEEIIRKSGALVQVAGGIRSIDTVRDWVDTGAGRVVMATAAVKNPIFVKSVANTYPDQVVVSIDVHNGKVVVDGWREATVFDAIEFAQIYQDVPLAGFIFTDIDRDHDLPLSSMALTAELAAAVSIPVISSGLVKTLDDISTLQYLPNIAGAIVGRALFEEAFALEEAIAIVEHPPEPAAPFQ